MRKINLVCSESEVVQMALVSVAFHSVMAEEAQRRVESALSNFVDELEKAQLRKMQVLLIVNDR